MHRVSSAQLTLIASLASFGCQGARPPASSTAAPPCGAAQAEDGFREIRASDPAIRYVGRLDFSSPHAPRMAFPAVSIETQFEGDAIDLILDESAPGGADGTAYYDVSIDGLAPTKVMTCKEQRVYPLARELSGGFHTVRIAKRTEAQVGSSSFLGFRVRPGTSLRRPVAPPRLLEFVGDSITCGYGNEVSTASPDEYPFSSRNENALLAFGAITARALGADYVAVAASGRGLVRNYDGHAALEVPAFYDLTAPDSSGAAWDHRRHSPDVIVVNLGTNDFSIGLDPRGLSAMRAEFRRAYEAFLERLRATHPRATLIAAVGPMINDAHPPGYKAWTSIRADVQGVVAARASAGDTDLLYFEFEPQSAPYGEDWHPTVATHRAMAERLSAFIQQKMGW